MSAEHSILTGHSLAKNPHIAVKEFHAAVYQPNIELIIFFCSSHYDLNDLANEINSCFPNQQVIGCTTAGEIGPAGYTDYSLSGVSFSSDGFTVSAGHIDDLQNINNEKGYIFVNHLLQQLESRAPATNSENTFAFLLIDGLSLREEQATRIFQNALVRHQHTILG